MCLIAFAIDGRPGLPLLLASNRDEFLDRPTQPLQLWQLPSGKQVAAGRDLQAGGSWIGLAEDGRIAMLTNVRHWPVESAPRSRGELVTGWLDSQADWQDWIAAINPARYAGFNLVLGDLGTSRWAWLSNRAVDTSGPNEAGLPPGWLGRSLGPGCYGLSNAGLDTPWPKTLALKEALARHLSQRAHADEAQDLLQALRAMGEADDNSLPRTGVPLDLERRLSSAFVHAPERRYGTRSSLIVHAGVGSLVLQEWTHQPRVFADTDQPAHWPLHHSQPRRLELDWPLPKLGQ